MAGPRLLLLDEPMAGVNPTLRVQLLEHVLELREREGVTFLLVEHDLELVMRASDTVVVMNEGRVIASGPPAAVRTDARVRRRVPRDGAVSACSSRSTASKPGTATRACCTASRSAPTRASSSASSARTAPASRRC